MNGTCRRCGATAENGACTLCGSTQIDSTTVLPTPQPAMATPPPVMVAPQLSPTPPPSPSRTPWVIAALAVVAAIGVVGWVVSTQMGRAETATPATVRTAPTIDSTEASTAPTTQPTKPPAATTTTRAPAPVATSAPRVDPNARARETLRSMAAVDLARTHRNGEWVAQLASKFVGVTDPRQTTSSGSHTFYEADILAEHEALRAQFSAYDVVLLDSRTYGKRRDKNGAAIWVTMVVNNGFNSEDSVLAWCGSQYPSLSGKDLLNICMPNRLNP